jgi:hypothetical protein
MREVRRHVRRGVEPVQAGNEVRGVVGPVGADHDPVPARHALDQHHGGGALGEAARLREPRSHDQARAVLHQQVAHEAEPGLLARALAEQPRLRVGALVTSWAMLEG